MSRYETDRYRQALPQPVTLSPEQIRQVAADTGALPPSGARAPVIPGIIRMQ